MNGVAERLMGGIGEEIKDIKKAVKDNDFQRKLNPFSRTSTAALTQCVKDATIIGEEEQKEAADL
jgi:hypothetical protein